MDKLIDYVQVYKNALGAQTCGELIDIIDSERYPVKDQMVNDNSKDKLIRSGCEVLLTHPDHNELKDNLVSSTISVLERYQIETRDSSKYIKENFDPYKLENFRARKYPAGSGFFKTHSDITDYKSASRLLVILMYLNDVDEGGETEFPTLGIKIKPTKGLVVVFPPTFLFPHRANMPKSNHKYTCQTYLHYK